MSCFWKRTVGFAIFFTSAAVSLAVQDIAEGVVSPTIPGPTNYSAHVDRARDYQQNDDWLAAARELTEAIKKAPVTMGSRPDVISQLYAMRALNFEFLGATRAAFDDCDKALQLNPDSEWAPWVRSRCFKRLRQFGREAQELDKAARANARTAYVYLNDEAWILATCSDAAVRNGRRAVELATRACELKRWKDWHVIDTLAAAYAESGDFAQAIGYQRRAVAQAWWTGRSRKRLEEKIALYETRHPYRDPRF
ncbi:MAG: hypothetical protein ACJ8IQ_10235 [Chthoniobacterales bacterium]